jgi:hypothetical protein
MALDSSQRAGGISPVADADSAPATAEERAQKEAQFIEHQNERSLARSRVMAKHGESLKNLTSAEAREVTTAKLVDMELRAMAQEKTAPAPPAPAAAVKEAGPVTEEKPLSILEISQWIPWDHKAYSPEVYAQFVGVFIPELSLAVADMPKDMQKSTALMHQIEMLFKHQLFKMYLNAYPTVQSAEDKMAVERQLSGWLNERWAEVLAAARRLPPVR